MDRMRRTNLAEVQVAVEKSFPGMPERRQARPLRYAMRLYSGLRSVEIARLLGRSPSAVTMACNIIESDALHDRALGLELRRLPADLGDPTQASRPNEMSRRGPEPLMGMR